MKYLCLIYHDEQQLDAMPAADMSALNAAHLDFNDRIRATGRQLVADALEPARKASCVRIRKGKMTITDGPFAEAKEMVAGFYFFDARDMDEAIEIASQIPSASVGTIEIRPARQLHVDGREPRWG